MHETDTAGKPVARVNSTAPGIRLGRLFGVEVHLDWSLLLVFALITFNLGAGLFRFWHPGWGPALRWGTAVAAAALFFVSIFAHELSHALMGRLLGVRIDRITLFIFGGAAHMHGEPSRPAAELAIAGIGPIVSLLIGVGSTALGMALSRTFGLDWSDPEQAELVVSAMGPVPTLLLWLGPINVLLAVFNLVPGFPLDGGRVVRALLWAITGDFVKATRWAARGGQVVAALLIGLGVIELAGGRPGHGIWLMLIGWFLLSAARISYQQAVVREVLTDVPVGRLMRTHLGKIAPQLTVDQFVSQHLMASEQRAWPVEDQGRFVGLMVWDDVRGLPQPVWSTTQISEVMTPRSELSTLDAGAGAEQALELFAERDVDQIPIVHGEQLLGLVRRADLLKWYALQHGERPGPPFLRPA
jgi:Zn-dependent protease